MKIQHNISLKNYNTFGIDVTAKRFISVDSVYQLQQLLKTEKDIFLISGGSNMLLTKDIEKLVIHIDINGISIDNEDDNNAYITVNAGENWHEFVLWCVGQNYGGIENLSLIPGNVGTCPIQNIGAYGVEVKDTITKVEALEIETQKLVSFANDECNFGYRNSIFKNEVKGKYIITSVSFKLTKNEHQLNTSYGAIETELASKKIEKPSLKNISDAVIAIRKSKLPDPKEIGNSGSFFKNPVIDKSAFLELQKKYPKIPSYTISENEIKVPAGWLIEKAGFKGKRFGNFGVHEKQALVLVNYGNASGKEIYQLAKKIQQTILEQFKISLEIEVNIIK
ncbi:UDP-N-acetylenolpyruvoylglucosamine reductase [Polaribacter reichenbachii]|uniref:UDP-N-acetylenolpyruvoylglucosamine reductase n=1 Tax=Polaribacter reichenbachii TaxID=996801 RepID=A0A1B8TPT6_9FLAO|nr:UDP-N-acetylmuramate dehydrogenase [Polaribacter reichenbachii]APZ46834.1 UDP-N-acetylenolpyruvoylglucosamine reductase [Polaribacter reichenbachii]AUC17477.1 UDP-N-acetylenolpyruvoylglucosamine reductase [Polaribacter reichenbachii]OBY61647.1 UDP-N-acetylenolpyruvoylglucosamine reductase [Polaribacter reichenbachii]